MKKKVILGLFAVAVLGGIVGGVATLYSGAEYNARREVIEKATKTVLQRTCEPADDKDCDFARRLSAAVISSASIYDDKNDMLKYASVSSHMKPGEYSRAAEIIEFVLKDSDNNADKAVERAVNNYIALRKGPKFDVDAYLKEIRVITEKRDRYQSVATAGGVIALIAGGLLALIGLWALFLAMIRSVRRAWINPNG